LTALPHLAPVGVSAGFALLCCCRKWAESASDVVVYA